MLIMTSALIMTAATGFLGFLAGREYDRYIKRLNYNRRLRRERAERLRMEKELNRRADEEKAKSDYMFEVQFNGPRRGGYDY